MDYYSDKGRQTDDNMSSPPPVRYHGLLNQGETCYLNSVLQVLFMTEDFRQAVERHCCENPATEWIDHQLKDLFDDLKGQTANTYNITNKLGISRVDEQQDAAEYYEKILSLTSPDASQIFHGCVTDRTTCSSCGTETDTDGAFWHLPLALVDSCSEHYSVVDGIKEHFRASEFSGENQMYCEKCDNKCDATIQCVMKHHPEVLMLLLKRFDFDYRYMTYVKINQTVDVPRTLQIPENQTYELYAVVDHSGDLRGGCYTATIRDDEKWFNFCDSKVTLADYQPFQLDNFEKSCSAYLLFYRKQNDTQPTRLVSAPAEAENQTEEMELLLRVTQPEHLSVDDQDSEKESARDVSADLKPEMSDVLVKDARLRKEVQSEEETGETDVKTGEDKQSEEVEDNAGENVDGNLRCAQEVVQDDVLKPVSEDEQREERGGRTEAGEREITSETGWLNSDFSRDGGSKQNMPKDDHQRREERMEAQKVEEQKRGNDKHAQRDTSVTERYSEGVQAQDSDSVRRDDPSLHPEQKIQKDVELDKKGKTEVNERGMGSRPTKLLTKYDLVYYSVIQDDTRVDDNKQKVPKVDQRCEKGGRSRYEGHEQERGVRRGVKGVTEQKRGDSEHQHFGQDVEDQSIVGLDDRQTMSEQKINGSCTSSKDVIEETQSKAGCGEQGRRSNPQLKSRKESNNTEIKTPNKEIHSETVEGTSVQANLSNKFAELEVSASTGEQVRRSNSQEKPGSKSIEVKMIDKEIRIETVPRSPVSSDLRRDECEGAVSGEQVTQISPQLNATLESTREERPGLKSIDIKITDTEIRSETVAGTSAEGNLSKIFAKLKVGESTHTNRKQHVGIKAGEEETNSIIESKAGNKRKLSDTEDQENKKGLSVLPEKKPREKEEEK